MSDPTKTLLEVNQKYDELLQTTKEYATAAHNHPEVAYDMTASQITDQKPRSMTENEAYSNILATTPILSQKWQETQETFMFDLEEAIEIHRTQKSPDQEIEEACQEIKDQYDQLEEELQKLDHAVQQITQTTPSDQIKTYKLQANTFLEAD